MSVLGCLVSQGMWACEMYILTVNCSTGSCASQGSPYDYNVPKRKAEPGITFLCWASSAELIRQVMRTGCHPFSRVVPLRRHTSSLSLSMLEERSY